MDEEGVRKLGHDPELAQKSAVRGRQDPRVHSIDARACGLNSNRSRLITAPASWFPPTMISASSRTRPPPRSDPTVSDQVAQTQDRVDALMAGVRQARIEGLPVSMNIGYDRVSHVQFTVRSS